MSMKMEALLIVPDHGLGNFRAEAAGQSWFGATSRSAKTKLVRALRARFGRHLCVQWSLVLPDPVASDLEAFRCLSRDSAGRDRKMLGDERLAVAAQLLGCRLSVAEAAYAIGITPAWLGRQLGSACA